MGAWLPNWAFNTDGTLASFGLSRVSFATASHLRVARNQHPDRANDPSPDKYHRCSKVLDEVSESHPALPELDWDIHVGWQGISICDVRKEGLDRRDRRSEDLTRGFVLESSAFRPRNGEVQRQTQALFLPRSDSWRTCDGLLQKY